jgi:hypothetical protein
MNAEEKSDLPEVAAHFASSMRGQYIIGQALAVAIETMSKVPKPHTEVSNIEDMQFLLEHLYPLGFMSMVATQAARDQIELFEKNTTSEGDANGTEKEKG